MTRDVDRDDVALRTAFAELHRGEADAAPSFVQLMARRRSQAALAVDASRRPARHGGPRVQRRLMLPSAVRRLVPRLAATAAVVVAAAAGVWLGRTRVETGTIFGVRDVEPLAAWVAPTDFLLDTPAAELLRTTPAISGPLLLDLGATEPNLPTGETR